MIPPHSPLLLCPRERHPKFCLKWKIKLGRRHANDRIALVVQFDLLSKDILAAYKVRLPKFVADHHHVAVPRLIFFFKKSPPEDGLHAQRRKKISRYRAPFHRLRLPHARQIKIAEAHGAHLFEGVILVAPVKIVSRRNNKLRNSRKTLLRRRVPHRHEPPRISKRQRPEQHSIHHAEDRGIRADAESEREDGDGGEARILAQYAQAVTKIHEEVFDGWPAPDGAAVLFRQSDIAKLAARGGGSFFSRHAGGNEFRDLFFEVFLNLFGKIVVETATGKQLF